MVSYNSFYTTIKSFHLNNTKAQTFQITTPISYKRTNTSTTTGTETIIFNGVNIRIYKDSILYASSIVSDNVILLTISNSDTVPITRSFTTSALGYNYETYLTNITFSFTTDSTIRDNTTDSIISSYYDIQGLVDWNKTTSSFLGGNPNSTTGFNFNTTNSTSSSTGGSFTAGANGLNYQSANLRNILTSNYYLMKQDVIFITTFNYKITLGNIANVYMIDINSTTNGTFIYLNKLSMDYNGRIFLFRKTSNYAYNLNVVFSVVGMSNVLLYPQKLNASSNNGSTTTASNNLNNHYILYTQRSESSVGEWYSLFSI